jgi:hypothetical protein
MPRLMLRVQIACYLAWSSWAGAVPASANDIVLKGPETALADFPVEALQRPPADVDDSKYADWLKTRPALVLDGTTLRFGRPGAAVSLAIQVSRFELRNAAQIITYGSDFQISAPTIVSENGSIKAFDTAASSPPQVKDGVPGQTGFSGGRVTLQGALTSDSRLSVLLDGQDGGQGGQGRPGQPGGSGPPGDHAADHLFDCAHGGGAGGRGQPGQAGEQGAKGGNGGDGGTLVLKGKIALQIDQLTVSYSAGAPGAGGAGGVGGPGGAGGPGGGGSTYCRGGSSGPNGPPGEFGPSGSPGVAGKPGKIVANP